MRKYTAAASTSRIFRDESKQRNVILLIREGTRVFRCAGVSPTFLQCVVSEKSPPGRRRYNVAPKNGCHSSSGDAPLEKSQPEIRRNRQTRGRNCSRKNDLIVDHRDAAKDEYSQAPRANRRRNRGH